MGRGVAGRRKPRSPEARTEEVECPLAWLPDASAAGPPQAHAAAQRVFRHGLKAFASQGAFLLQVLADGDQLVIADALFELRPVGFGTPQRRISHRDETRWGVASESPQSASLGCALDQWWYPAFSTTVARTGLGSI